MPRDCDISVLIGMTITQVVQNDDEILFYEEGGRQFKLYHDQDCCENVYIEDVSGDLQDLVKAEIVEASIETNSNDDPPQSEGRWVDDSYTWTFIKIGSTKGFVTIRFFGTSNGYYSESADFAEIK